MFCGETNPLSPPRGWLIENQTIKEIESNGMRPGNLRPNLKLNPLLCELSVDLFLSVLSTPPDPKHLKNSDQSKMKVFLATVLLAVTLTSTSAADLSGKWAELSARRTGLDNFLYEAGQQK